MNETIIQIDHVSKEYRLGAIGGGTLKGDLQSLMARIRKREDPNLRIGQDVYTRGQRFRALEDVSFSVKKGERVGIIGHNGAGKSTLLKLLSRVTAPTEGTIAYNGRIASMLEVGTGFHPELTGRENIYLNGAILGMTKAEITKKFDDIVSFAEMERFIDTPVKRYSSGMYVKLAFAVAAHLDSEIMIMDEVLAVGDMKFQQKCLGKMDDVSKHDGRTVLYVSHNMNTIRQLCDRCIVLDKGRVTFDGDVEEGIGVYLESSVTDMRVELDLEKKRMKHLSPIVRAKITYLKLLNKQYPIYEMYEKIPFEMTVSSREKIDNVSVRLEVRGMDESSVGASILQNFSSLSVGENILRLNLEPYGLVPGRYLALLVLYQVNEMGTYDDLDAIWPTFVFEIQDNENKLNISWNYNMWGRIEFPTLSVLEEI